MRARSVVVGTMLSALLGSGLVPLAVTPAAAQEAPPPAPAPASTTLTSDGSTLVPVTPARLLDTRGKAPAAAGAEVAVPVTGRAGVPEKGVGTVVLSVMVVAPTSSGHLTAWPTGEAKPVASSLNYRAAHTVAGSVVVKVGKDGAVSIATHAPAHLVVDVQAWSAEGSGLSPVAPARLLDRRSGVATVDGKYVGGGRTAAKGTIDLPVAGRGGVPSDAGAVLLTVTVTGAAAPGHITAYPTGAARPTASNVNYAVGQTVPNLVLARVGSNGRVSLYVHAPAFVIVDVAGWFPVSSGLTPLVPARLHDGRSSGGPTRPGNATTIQVTGRGGVPATGVRTVALNVTALGAGASGGVTVAPAGVAKPVTTHLAYGPGQTIAGLVLVPVGDDGKVSLTTSSGAYLVVDVLGWSQIGTQTTSIQVPQGTVLLGPGDVVSVVPGENAASTVTLAGSADTLAVGNYVGLSASPSLPHGLLGRVVSMTTSAAGQRQVLLEPARIDEAIPQGEITYTGGLDTTQLNQRLATGRLSFPKACTAVGTLRLGIDIDITLDADVHWRWGGDGGFQTRAVLRPTIKTTSGLSGSIGGECTIPLPKWLFPIPTAPVPLTAELQPRVVVAGKLGEFKVGHVSEWTGVLGIERMNGEVTRFSEGRQVRDEWDLEVRGLHEAIATLRTSTAISLGMWGRAKLEVDGGPVWSVGIKQDGPDYTCELSRSTSITGSAVYDFVGFEQRFEIGAGVFGHAPLGSLGCGTEPPSAISLPGLDSGLVGVGYHLPLAHEGGIAPVSWGADGLPPGLRVDGRFLTGTPTAAGSYTVRLHVTDAAARRTERSYPLVISSPPPDLSAVLGKIARWSDGTAFFIDQRGGKHPIPSGGVYECLVAQGKQVVASSAGVTDPLPEYEDAACVRANPGDIVSSGSASYLVEAGFSLRHIVDGISYECLTANGHKAYGQVPRYWLLDLPQGQSYSWHCWNRDAAKGKVVRFSNGEAHYVDLRGGRHHVPDGGTYECLKAQRGDYGHVVPAGRLTEMTPYEPAQCVRANVGDVVSFGTASYLVADGFALRSITDGISYGCLVSNGHKVYGGVPRYWLLDRPQGAAYTWHCWNKELAKGKVVRFSDGSSWYVDLRGDRHHVPDGGTYECLKAQRGDYGSVIPADRLSEMTPYEPAQCVRANIGNIVKQGADSYLVGDGFSRRRITNGVSHDCLTANGHAVYSPEVPRYWLLDLKAGTDYTWNCWNSTTARGKVVRASDGSSWYVDLRGGRHWIPDGGTYECIKAQRGDYGHRVPRYSMNELTQYENAQCVRANPGDVVRHHDGDAYLYGSGTRRHIVDGRTYNCFMGRGRALVNGVPRYWLLDLSQGAGIGTNEACGFILRHSVDGDAHQIGHDGVRHWIPTGTVYNCLVSKGWQVFNTTNRTLINTGWPEGSRASC